MFGWPSGIMSNLIFFHLCYYVAHSVYSFTITREGTLAMAVERAAAVVPCLSDPFYPLF